MRIAIVLVLSCLAHAAYAQRIMHVPGISMEPTIVSGSLVRVDTSAYETTSPRRGDVVTYIEPSSGSIYAHRVIGLPGELVTYSGQKRILINGVELPVKQIQGGGAGRQIFLENVDGVWHQIQVDSAEPAISLTARDRAFQHRQCEYREQVLSCAVAAGSYFVLGDNRDHSWDSRFTGSVSRNRITGRVEPGRDR